MKYLILPTLLLLTACASMSANVTSTDQLEAKIDYALKLSLQNEVDEHMAKASALQSAPCAEVAAQWEPIGSSLKRLKTDVYELGYFGIVERIDKEVILLQSQINSGCGAQVLTWKT